MDPREELQKLVEMLATQRDELIVQAHLAKLEAQGEWGDLEDKFASLRADAERVAGTAEEAGRDVAAAARLLGEEIERGYEKLRRLF